MAEALKNLCVCFSPWIFLKPDQLQEGKKKTWSVKLRLTLDIATADPCLGWPIRECCSSRVDEPIAASSAGSHVSSIEMCDRHTRVNEAEKQLNVWKMILKLTSVLHIKYQYKNISSQKSWFTECPECLWCFKSLCQFYDESYLSCSFMFIFYNPCVITFHTFKYSQHVWCKAFRPPFFFFFPALRLVLSVMKPSPQRTPSSSRWEENKSCHSLISPLRAVCSSLPSSPLNPALPLNGLLNATENRGQK